MRSLGLPLISFGLTGAVVANAYYQKKQFYPSVVYITKSNSSMAVIYIQALILVILIGKLVKKIFFGQLRAAEFEHLMERSWYAVTETCLAFTVFKDDFSPKFVALFTLLLFLKAFHWLTEDRVDFMERSPMISYIFHIRIIVLLTMLGLLDLYFIVGAYQTTVTKGASVMIVFGFEYAILMTVCINILIKYLLHTIDLNREVFWENKAVFFLYMELVMSFVKVIMYVVFVLIMMRVYTLPLFAFRPMYYAARSFRKALKDVINSRSAIHHLNNSFPDATSEELTEADNVCIICREEMQSASKKLPCNHIFHTSCLRSWFQRHQTCPTCRTSILEPVAPSRDAPQPPPQAPQQPPLPPFAFPFNPLHMPFQPPHPPQQQPQGSAGGQGAQQAPGASTSGTTPGASSGRPGSQPQQPPPPFSGFPGFPMFPGMPMPGMGPSPFLPSMMPFMAYSIPPPIPPPDFTGLTDEQLRAMESNAREGVESRLRCLQNIQLLLDAATLMLQQYSVAAASVNVANTMGTAQSPQPASSTSGEYQQGPDLTTDPQPPLGASSPTRSTPTSSSKVSQSSPSSQDVPTPESNPQPSTSGTSMGSSSSSLTNGGAISETEEQREIRLRRLQKFATNSGTNE
uniref:RING-type E3 ubiquitin transferase n=2 Tax=Cacopsylla melanoneura TaxID=428564 RepID=A0A8D9AKL9_9HEMI